MREDLESTSIKKSKAPLYISAGIILSVFAAYFLIPGVSIFFDDAWQVLSSNDESRIKNWVSRFGWLGPLVLILTMVIQMFLLVIPSILLMVVSILAYGPVWGSLIVFAAIFTASSVGYFIGRYLGQVMVDKLIGQSSERKIGEFIKTYGFWAVIVTRTNPILSNDAISFVSGILKLGYFRFIGATLVGIAPLILFIAIMGKTTDGLMTGLIWGSILSLILFLGLIWWDKKRKK